MLSLGRDLQLLEIPALEAQLSSLPLMAPGWQCPVLSPGSGGTLCPPSPAPGHQGNPLCVCSGGNFLQELLWEPEQMEETESSWVSLGDGDFTVLQTGSGRPEMQLDTPRSTQGDGRDPQAGNQAGSPWGGA